MKNKTVKKNSSSGGRLEERNGVKILFINGSNYEMGCQHGYLLKKEIHENVRGLIDYSEQKGFSYNELLKSWNIMKDYVPKYYIEEINGLADGSGISFERLNAANMITIVLARELVYCSGMAAWGTATEDNKLIFARSFDYPLWMRDPMTRKYLQENQVLIVRKPDKGYASSFPTFAGFLGMPGINEKGIGIGLLYSWSTDNTFKGIPVRYVVQKVLDHTFNVEDAIDIITSNTTMGYNFLICDGKIPIGYAVEANSAISYVGTWDNLVESTHPFWAIDHVVRRTNLFISPKTAATQRKRYNPASLVLMLLGKNKYFPMWRHYNGLSKGIEKQWGSMNLNNVMSMFREVYCGKTDVILFMVQRIEYVKKWAKQFGFLQAVNQWVACPETGDMLISFASADKNAFENTVYHFNLFELLDSTPHA